jgi:hypothetical protein
MRDFSASAAFAAFIDSVAHVDRSSKGSRCRKLRLSRAESKRRSMAGMIRREQINRHNAIAFIEEDPRRLAEYRRRRYSG